MKARAAVLRSRSAPFSIEEVEVQEPEAGEVAVAVEATGVCHSDFLPRELPEEHFRGAIVRGHEGAGTVIQVGEGVTSVEVGDKVVLSFNSCGHCPACEKHKDPYCFDFMLYNTGGRPDGSSAFTDAHGQAVLSHFFGQSSFATRTIAAERSVVKMPADTDLVTAAPLACGIQTGAGAIINSLSVEAGASVVVAGAGTLGLSAIMAAKLVGADPIIAIDRHQGRLELARKYGAVHCIQGSPEELTGQIQQITGRGADYAFDATGNAEVVKALYDGLNNIGVLGLSGIGTGEISFNLFSMVTGRTIRGLMEGDSVPSEFIPVLAAYNKEGKLPYDELITRYPLDEINEAERDSLSGEVVKPVLVMGE